MSEAEDWRQEPSQKANQIARDAELLAQRARAAGLATAAYILELAAKEARKDFEWTSTEGVRER